MDKLCRKIPQDIDKIGKSSVSSATGVEICDSKYEKKVIEGTFDKKFGKIPYNY